MLLLLEALDLYLKQEKNEAILAAMGEFLDLSNRLLRTKGIAKLKDMQKKAYKEALERYFKHPFAQTIMDGMEAPGTFGSQKSVSEVQRRVVGLLISHWWSNPVEIASWASALRKKDLSATEEEIEQKVLQGRGDVIIKVVRGALENLRDQLADTEGEDKSLVQYGIYVGKKLDELAHKKNGAIGRLLGLFPSIQRRIIRERIKEILIRVGKAEDSVDLYRKLPEAKRLIEEYLNSILHGSPCPIEFRAKSPSYLYSNELSELMLGKRKEDGQSEGTFREFVEACGKPIRLVFLWDL